MLLLSQQMETSPGGFSQDGKTPGDFPSPMGFCSSGAGWAGHEPSLLGHWVPPAPGRKGEWDKPSVGNVINACCDIGFSQGMALRNPPTFPFTLPWLWLPSLCSELVQEPLPSWFSLPSMKDVVVPPLSCNLGNKSYLPSYVCVVCPGTNSPNLCSNRAAAKAMGCQPGGREFLSAGEAAGGCEQEQQPHHPPEIT